MMNGSVQDSLRHVPEEKWEELKDTFLVDLPKGISAYKLLETQIEWKKGGQQCDFTVYCPYGDFKNGMVAFFKMNVSFEIVILTPTEDTTLMKKALKETKRIDWGIVSKVLYAPGYIIECLKDLGIKPKFEIRSKKSFLHKTAAPYKDLYLPPNVTFGKLTVHHAPLVNECWPHRYLGSVTYFEMLINVNYGFGLFLKNEIISWVFINESGALGNMYTLKQYRRKGYGEVLIKLMCNELLKEGKDILVFTMETNTAAFNLFNKLGFEYFNEAGVTWWYLNIVRHSYEQ